MSDISITIEEIGKIEHHPFADVVVTPLKESFSPVLGGRMIVKSVSADYLDRRGAKDNG